MNTIKLAKQVFPLMPEQKVSITPKVGGYIKDTYFKLITNEQIINNNNYTIEIRQIPYESGYIKLNYIEDVAFKYETIYRLSLSGKKIKELFNFDEISCNITINLSVSIDKHPKLDIEYINVNSFYTNNVNKNTYKKMHQFLNSDEFKTCLYDSSFYDIEVISLY